MKRGNNQKNSHDLFYGQGAFGRTTEIKSKHMSNKPAGEIIKKKTNNLTLYLYASPDDSHSAVLTNTQAS